MTFEEWLSSVWQEDENRIIRKRQIDKLRDDLKVELISIFEGNITGSSGCMCDSCIGIIIRQHKEHLMNQLMTVGLEYLLGENFNGASAHYYYNYVKMVKDET